MTLDETALELATDFVAEDDATLDDVPTDADTARFSLNVKPGMLGKEKAVGNVKTKFEVVLLDFFAEADTAVDALMPDDAEVPLTLTAVEAETDDFFVEVDATPDEAGRAAAVAISPAKMMLNFMLIT